VVVGKDVEGAEVEEEEEEVEEVVGDGAKEAQVVTEGEETSAKDSNFVIIESDVIHRITHIAVIILLMRATKDSQLVAFHSTQYFIKFPALFFPNSPTNNIISPTYDHIRQIVQNFS
jgi:hypothetical protein